MSTIPASAFVNVTPNVLAAGGSALDLIGLMLTNGARVPIGDVLAFANAPDVSDYFGGSSDEAALAVIYFNGFKTSNAKPGSLLFSQYPTAAVSAYLRGGDISDMTLAELQALTPATLAVIIDAVLHSATINLSAATSFSSAAQIIQTALAITGVAAASVTGSITGTTLTVTAVGSGSLAVGDKLTGTGMSAAYITGLLTGTGGTGTYLLSGSQSAVSQTITATLPAVTYDSIAGAFTINSGTTGALSTLAYGSGAMATSLLLTSVTGAVLSQGAAVGVPGTFMDAVVAQTQNWATFMTTFDPDASGNTNKLAFSAWTSDQDNRYAFICWDTDLTPSASSSAAASLGALIDDAEYSGTCLIGQDEADTDLVEVAAFVCGYGASLDFAQLNGRATAAYKAQDGLTATCTDETAMNNLIANGYNFYGAAATANDDFNFFYDGSISGDFAWMDSFLNEVWMTNSFQLAGMTLLTQQNSIPYNSAGRALIEAAFADPITAALNFGAIRAGVTLSESQAAAVNAAAGVTISKTLETRGWYLQVLDASAAVRTARGSPPCTFWYTDGQSVQKIDLTSINVQ